MTPLASMSSVERGATIVLGVLGLVIILALVGLLLQGGFGPPSSEVVVVAFKDEGLEVGDYYPVEKEKGWERSLVPKNYEEATRFLIPSLGPTDGGRVFVFEDPEDMEVMRGYYQNLKEMPLFGKSMNTHLYTEGSVLLQINGESPKSEADRYGEVTQEEV